MISLLLQSTNASMIKRLSFLLTDILNTGEIDYLTDDNTAVIYEEQLPPLTVGSASGRRLLLGGPRDEIMEVGAQPGLLALLCATYTFRMDAGQSERAPQCSGLLLDCCPQQAETDYANP